MKFRRLFRALRGQEGQSLVEFAIILPVLLLILCAVVDIGRIVDAKVLVQSAASEGIRHVVSTTNINSQVISSISDYGDRLDFSNLQISSSVGNIIQTDYDYHYDAGSSWDPLDSYFTHRNVTITLSYELPIIMPFSKYFLGNNFTMSSTYTAQLFLAGYPQWTPTYTVTYNRTSASSGSVPVDSTAYHQGDTVTVLGNTGGLAKNGYRFVGWAKNASGTTPPLYVAGNTFAMGSANVTLYAKWTRN